MLVTVSFTKYKVSQKDVIMDINKSSADYLHIDLFDGKFVPTIQQLPAELKKILPIVQKKLDVHIMAVDPLKYLDFFASENTEYYTFHYEAAKDVETIIETIKKTGLKVGIAISIETDVQKLKPFLSLVDQILIMASGGGYGGDPFQLIALDKIKYLKEEKTQNNYHYIINVDCGINSETISLVKEAGVDMVVSGSFVCLSDNLEEAVQTIKK